MSLQETSLHEFDHQKVAVLECWIKAATYVVFFGGAGVSTASGLLDFRSAKGLYQQHFKAEKILTLSFLQQQPEAFYDFYRQYFMVEGIKPNSAHKYLAKLETEGKLKAVITQNVDNLHTEAGSKNVIELHGNGTNFYCLDCHQPFSLSTVKMMPQVPRCTCGGLIRPDIVLYGEALKESSLRAGINYIQRSDLLIIGGTSLSVFPAAGLIAYQQNGKKVYLNQEVSDQVHVDLTISASITDIFKYFLKTSQ